MANYTSLPPGIEPVLGHTTYVKLYVYRIML